MMTLEKALGRIGLHRSLSPSMGYRGDHHVVLINVEFFLETNLPNTKQVVF